MKPSLISAHGPSLIITLLTLTAALLLHSAPVHAQMKTGSAMKNFDAVFGVKSGERTYPYTVTTTESAAPGSILFPGESGAVRFQIVNHLNRPIQTQGHVDVIPYGTRGIPGDIWLPEVVKLGDVRRIPIEVKLAPDGFQNVAVTPPIPETKGAYALVVDLGEHGRQFLTSLVRTFQPDPKRLQYPKFSLDHLPDDVLRRLGVQSIRMGVEWWLPNDPNAGDRLTRLDEQIKTLQENNITVMLMVGASPVPQPLGRPRPHLTDDGTMMSTKSDMAWLPEHDDEFRAWVAKVAARYGWPKGPVTAFNLWNEPWEGLSISGWGADMPRYREIFSAMARGIEDARKSAKVEVLITGADSSSNTWDKFFSDGTDDYLKWLDAVTIHYQGMASPAVYKMWRNRKHPNGRVKIWDTESWVANTDDRVAAVVAANRAAGYDRSMGIYGGNIASGRDSVEVFTAPGKKERVPGAATVWPVAASVGAMQHFLGEREFRELLFKNGLPWVMVFEGLNGKANDGTVVLVGDLGEAFGHENVLFRTVRTLDGKDVNGVRQGTLAIPADPAYSLYDFYGNPVPASGGRIVVPLDHRGFFLRPSGKPGSFQKLLAALKTADVRGFEPVEMIPHDLTAPLEENPTLRVKVTNVLNRPVSGKLGGTMAGLVIDSPGTVDLKPGETKTVPIKVMEGKSRPDNTYPLALRFDAGADGVAKHEEAMRVNVIARKTIEVDGELDDWKGAVPQPVRAKDSKDRTVTEASWFPFVKFDPSVGSGLANGYVAYDKDHFYFAAKVADTTPDAGTVRFETRNDDEYFYPAVSYEPDPDATLQWKLTKNEVDVNDASSLQLPAGEGRSKTYWEDTDTNQSFAFDLSLPKGKPTQVALYLGPWDNHEGIGVRTVVTDRATGKELDSRRTERLWKGAYLVWNLSGDVRIRVRPDGDWYTAKVLGLFFDEATAPMKADPPSVNATTATFIKTDLDTLGNWRGVYGKRGHSLAGLDPQLPPGVTLAMPTEMKRKEHRWPEGVRRFSYRKWPVLPVGHFIPAYDNVQIAFNVLPQEKKTTILALPGTMPKFTTYHDTDYEYALNKVAPEYGGGTEVWRLQYPGMPRKHFYPRQPKSPVDGPVKAAKLAVRHEGVTRIVEAAIPWDEIPAVRDAMLAGKPVKFSFLVNDAGGAGLMELGRERSVAKLNPSFHVDWAEHWANELEFGWEK